MHAEVLRPPLRPVYGMIVYMLGSAAFFVACLGLSALMAAGIRVMCEPEMNPRAPVLSLPASEEEPTVGYSGYFGYDGGETKFRDLTIGNGTLVESAAFTTNGVFYVNGNMTMGDDSSDLHTINGVIEIRRSDDEMTCTITIDPLSGIIQECEINDAGRP